MDVTEIFNKEIECEKSEESMYNNVEYLKTQIEQQNFHIAYLEKLMAMKDSIITDYRNLVERYFKEEK